MHSVMIVWFTGLLLPTVDAMVHRLDPLLIFAMLRSGQLAPFVLASVPLPIQAPKNTTKISQTAWYFV